MKYLKYIPNWKPTSYKEFDVQLYQESYPHWKLLCQSSLDGKVLGPREVVTITSDANAVKTWASVLFGFIIAMLVLCIFNFLILLITAKDAKKKLVKVSNVRMVISLLFTIVCGISLFFLFFSSSSKDLQYLSTNECSDDVIMNKSFVTMH